MNASPSNRERQSDGCRVAHGRHPDIVGFFGDRRGRLSRGAS